MQLLLELLVNITKDKEKDFATFRYIIITDKIHDIRNATEFKGIVK